MSNRSYHLTRRRRKAIMIALAIIILIVLPVTWVVICVTAYWPAANAVALTPTSGTFTAAVAVLILDVVAAISYAFFNAVFGAICETNRTIKRSRTRR